MPMRTTSPNKKSKMTKTRYAEHSGDWKKTKNGNGGNIVTIQDVRSIRLSQNDWPDMILQLRNGITLDLTYTDGVFDDPEDYGDGNTEECVGGIYYRFVKGTTTDGGQWDYSEGTTMVDFEEFLAKNYGGGYHFDRLVATSQNPSFRELEDAIYKADEEGDFEDYNRLKKPYKLRNVRSSGLLSKVKDGLFKKKNGSKQFTRRG